MKRRREAFQKLQTILVRRRDLLQKALRQEVSRLKTGSGIDIGDAADIAVDDEFNLLSSQLAESESRELAQIDEALQRIRRGQYGLCEECGQEILLARLQALPYARHCVNCQRELEQHSRGNPSRLDWSNLSDHSDDEPHVPMIDHVIDLR